MNRKLDLWHGKAFNIVLFVVLLAIVTHWLTAVPLLEAAIVSSGNISPALPWSSSTTGYVGQTSNGSLTINGGSLLQSGNTYIANAKGVTGAVTVTGAGSKWTISSHTLYVGVNGSGTLNIEGGAQVNISEGFGYLGLMSGSTGTATVTGTGSKWNVSGSLFVGASGSGSLTVNNGGEVTAGSLYASLEDLHGNGTITTYGAVMDIDLRFDSTHGTQQTLSFGSGGTLKITANGVLGAGNKGNGSLTITDGIVLSVVSGVLGSRSGSTGTAIVTGAGSKWTNYSELYVGDDGNGTLNIEAGAEVSNTSGYLGYGDGQAAGSTATGTVIVTGIGSKWTNTGVLTVGNFGSGMLNIEAGAQVSSSSGYLGYMSLSSGMVTVTGLGSKWTNSGMLYVGYYGNGTLNIEAGAQVSNTTCYLGNSSGSMGAVKVTGAGSKWTNSSDLYVYSGTLNIEAGAQVSDSSGHISSGPTGAVKVTGIGSKWTNSSDLYVGYGALNIEAGAVVSDSSGYLGDNSGSTATVTGAVSKWINSITLYVGQNSKGTLNIEAGAEVSDSYGYVGSSSTVTVTGIGSKWSNNNTLFVGNILHIRDGGNTIANSLFIYSNSLLTIDAGYGSEIRVGNGAGTINNSGKVRVMAGPVLSGGQQISPVVAATWSGSGTYQALGGTWNSTSHVFTVSPTLISVSGTTVNIDLTQKQRVLVEDSTSHTTVGASFLAKTGSGNTVSFTATAITGSDLTSLRALLPTGQSVFSAWDFTALGPGYYPSDPIYLSLGIPLGLARKDLHLWQKSSGNWTSIAADDLISASGYASFMSTSLSRYAVAGFLPATWKANADGVWQYGSNWTTVPNAPGGVNAAGILGSVITSPRTVTLDGPLTLGALTFDTAQHYTIAGADTLTLQANSGYSANILVRKSDANGQVIATPVALASPLEISIAPSSRLAIAGQLQNPTGYSLTLSGGGTLTVTQGIATTGAVNVQAGTLITPTLTADTLTIGGVAHSAASVPEPSVLALLIAGVIGVCVMTYGRMRSVP